MTAQAPLDRLTAADFYRQLDWVRDEWGTSDEYAMTRKLGRLRQLFQHLPDRYWSQAAPILLALGRDRLVATSPYRERILKLTAIVGTWEGARPPLLTCPECGVPVRGRHMLANHLLLVHDLEDVA